PSTYGASSYFISRYLPHRALHSFLHDALPISRGRDMFGKPVTVRALGVLARVLQHEADHLDGVLFSDHLSADERGRFLAAALSSDRKSTRLNSSHVKISYAVFCLKKKTTTRHW